LQLATLANCFSTAVGISAGRLHYYALEDYLMSHIVTVRTQVRDPLAIQSACSRLKLPAPVFGTAKLFVTEKTGWIVKLADWKYPVVCNTSTGEIDSDSYEGRWGSQQRLNEFLQAYAVEKAKIEVRKAGHTSTEHLLADGSIRVCVQVA
jgi:hypothetical protein